MAKRLNTELPLRLIGIQVFEQTAPHIKKALSNGWYPFLNCIEDIGCRKDKFPQISSEVCPLGFYNIEEGLPRITISAIVGKNGSGKSSILDILYRILNNFAYATFVNKPGKTCDEIKLTRGLHARLHFEQDGIQRYINVEDEYISYHEINNGISEEKKLFALSDNERNLLLNRFFYTISVNYSIYAFNPNDYETPFNTNEFLNRDDPEWMNYLFHKNDGYYIPLVLTPFRNNGELNISNENVLAEQRINVLSLLYHSQDKEFLENYIPYKLCYRFNVDYKHQKLKEFRSNLRNPELKICLDLIIEHFVQAWDKYLNEVDVTIPNSRREIETFYLAYKALKICLTYPAFIEKFHLYELLSLAKPYSEHFKDLSSSHYHNNRDKSIEEKVVAANDCQIWLTEHTKDINKIVCDIVENSDHVTSKIHQCLSYIKKNRYKTGYKILTEDLLNNNRYETYDEILNLLPPPFYESELYYKRIENKIVTSEEITLRSMSSGERQMLNSISYICYHIKNISSKKKKGKRVVGYHHVNLIFDEAELYYHPEFQRRFVKLLLERLAMCHINRTNIRSINIILVTHSPFILSDIPESNIMYLGEEKHNKSALTFGSNIYDLLQNSFFLNSDIGAVAQLKIEELIEIYNSPISNKTKKIFTEKYPEFQYVQRHIGETYIRKTYRFMLEELEERYGLLQDNDYLMHKYDEVEREYIRLKNLLQK